MEYFKFLPVEIGLDILTRLPIESVLDCKLVCTKWRRIVRHPSFSKMHLQLHHHNQPSTDSDSDSGKLSFVFRSKSNFRQLCYFEYDENQEKISRIRKFNFTLPVTCCGVLGSFNGLVCLYGCHPCQDDEFYGPACICNPITKEYVILPKCNTPANLSGNILFGGFGYLPSSSEYKVVRIYKLLGLRNFIEVEVYTLGSGNGWRNLGKFGYSFDIYYGAYGAFANGALHWIDMEGRIVAFDLAEEKFCGRLMLPSSLNLAVSKLGVWDGNLLFGVNHVTSASYQYDIWILKTENDNHDLKEQEKHEYLGWSKEFTLVNNDPFAFTKTGCALGCRYRNLCIYDPKSSTSTKLADFGSEVCRVLPHKNSFVSLKELGEQDAKIMKSVETGEVQSSGLPT